MEITYEKYNKEYKDSSSRYQILRVINDSEERYLETYNPKTVPILEGGDVYHVVSSTEEGRLDIISNKYYGSPTLWWAIALANEFIDPFVVNAGEMIRIPSLLTLSSIDSEILSRRGGPT